MFYSFFNKLMLRAPLFSHQEYSLNNLSTVLANPVFQKAMYLANPVFFKLLESKGFDLAQLTSKEMQTLLKYYNRVCFRSTPLGMFATFSLVEWGHHNQIALDNDILLRAHVDHKVQVDLARAVFPQELLSDSYLPNPCIYRVYKEYRFVKTVAPANGDKLIFAVEALDRNGFTSKLLKFSSKKARSGTEIVDFISAETGCDVEEATDYFQFLVDAQVLRSVNNVNITGTDYLKRLLSLSNLTGSKQKLLNELLTLAEPYATLPQLKAISGELASLNFDAQNSNSFYSVSERRVLSGGVNVDLQQQLLNGLQVLHKLTSYQPNLNLKDFIKKFKARYDMQKVPLLHAVDPETGIGYSSVTSVMHNLVPEGRWKKTNDNGTSQLQWTNVHRLFMQLWCTRSGNPNLPIVLTDSVLAGFDNKEEVRLAPTTAIMFRQGDGLLQIESAGGISALGLIGRFSIFNDDVETLCRQVAYVEEANNPGVIFGELAQLSNLHVDNINRRKHAYRYEIPINAVSTLPPAQQIALDDLWLSVVNDELILESRKKGKRVIPRLSSAYNVINNDLGVFRLLCDIQTQGVKAGFGISLENLFPGLQFYPRVQYHNIVLSLGVWVLGDAFIKQLKSAKDDYQELRFFNELKNQWQFPKHIALNKGDQFLVFDLDNEGEVLFLISCIKTLNTLRLQEYLPDDSGTVRTNGHPLSGQYVALLYHQNEVYKPVGTKREAVLYNLKRTYVPGSEWLYLKLYCDPAFANQLLVKKVLLLIKQLQKDKSVKEWFFVRYTDTGYHLRLRMKLHDGVESGHVLHLFKNKMFDVVHYRLIKEYLADSYQPELERYGHDVIHDVESFFYRSSELVSAFTAATIDQPVHFEIYGFALITVNAIIDLYIDDPAAKLGFYNQMSAAFYSEFADDKQLRVEMDNTFRNFKADIVNAFVTFNEFKSLRLKREFHEFKRSAAHLAQLLEMSTDMRKRQFLSDIIHMHVNRIFTTKQRQQELLVYYFLAKYTQSVNAMARSKLRG